MILEGPKESKQAEYQTVVKALLTTSPPAVRGYARKFRFFRLFQCNNSWLSRHHGVLITSVASCAEAVYGVCIAGAITQYLLQHQGREKLPAGRLGEGDMQSFQWKPMKSD